MEDTFRYFRMSISNDALDFKQGRQSRRWLLESIFREWRNVFEGVTVNVLGIRKAVQTFAGHMLLSVLFNDLQTLIIRRLTPLQFDRKRNSETQESDGKRVLKETTNGVPAWCSS